MWPVVEDLVDRGCIRMIEVKSAGAGRKPSPRIEVHPALRQASPRVTLTQSTEFENHAPLREKPA